MRVKITPRILEIHPSPFLGRVVEFWWLRINWVRLTKPKPGAIILNRTRCSMLTRQLCDAWQKTTLHCLDRLKVIRFEVKVLHTPGDSELLEFLAPPVAKQASGLGSMPFVSLCLSMVGIRPSSSMFTGYAVSLRGDCAIFCHAGSGRVGSVISPGKILWNTPSRLGIEAWPWGGRTVGYTSIEYTRISKRSFFFIEIKPGSIPGSKCLFWVKFLDENTKLYKSPEQLATIYKEHGVDPAAPHVATCGSGEWYAMKSGFSLSRKDVHYSQE